MSLKRAYLCVFLLAIIFTLGTDASTKSFARLTFPDGQVMSKRSAAALNQIILEAVRKGDIQNLLSFGDDENETGPARGLSTNFVAHIEKIPQNIPPLILNLQRRGERKADRRRYIRCYFNVVSCF